MASAQLQHRRTHNLLLISKLLNCRENVSIFTLVLDSLQQSAWPLTLDVLSRAKVSKLKTVFVASDTVGVPNHVAAENFIDCSFKKLDEISSLISSKIEKDRRCLIIFDSLHPVLGLAGSGAAQFLLSFTSPTCSIFAIYHKDIPIQKPNPYGPSHLRLLQTLATTVLTTHSMAHIAAQKEAHDRSVTAPVFGLDEEIEGIIVGSGSNEVQGTVVEMDYRRTSGRPIRDWFYVSHVDSNSVAGAGSQGPARPRDTVVLLEDHPRYPKPPADEPTVDLVESTFNLSITEKQKKDRDAVVLPYFDAQKDGSVGEGGRILYQMGREDDFDDEEDEI